VAELPERRSGVMAGKLLNAIPRSAPHSVVVTLISIGILLTAAGCEEDGYLGESNYNAREVIEWRHDKDMAFKDEAQSPLPKEMIANFVGLKYYEPDEEYAVEAVLNRKRNPDTVTILTTTDELRRAVTVGEFTFTLQFERLTLQAYQFIGGNRDELFVPFKDNTNGTTTYRGGRYLTVPLLEDDDAYVLDFNMAYNPYCVYSKAYSCPLVPASNVLRVSIEAGERK
jgi:uncharacterized protein